MNPCCGCRILLGVRAIIGLVHVPWIKTCTIYRWLPVTPHSKQVTVDLSLGAIGTALLPVLGAVLALRLLGNLGGARLKLGLPAGLGCPPPRLGKFGRDIGIGGLLGLGVNPPLELGRNFDAVVGPL